MSTALRHDDAAGISFDLAEAGLRTLNKALQSLLPDTNETAWAVLNPRGAHALADRKSVV